MRVTQLTLAVAVASLSMSAGAVYNLYKKDGTTIDINAEVNVRAHKKSSQFDMLAPEVAGLKMYSQITSVGGWTSILSGVHEERSDKRVRLGQEEGSSWLEIRGSQRLPQDWRVTGTVGFGYYDNAYLSNANVAFDKKNVGAISVGRQYLHTGYVTRTGTYSPLNTFGAMSVRVDYTAIPRLHLSAFYGFPADSDVRSANNTNLEVESFGASGSYVYPFTPNSTLRAALGYTKSAYNPTTAGRESNQLPLDEKGAAGSLEYRYGKVLLAADYGIKKEDLNGNTIDKADSTMAGVKLGIEVTPKFGVTAGYGERKTERQTKDGVTVVPGYSAALGTTVRKDLNNIVLAYQSFLFDEVREKRSYVRADYLLRDNVRLYGRIDQSTTQTRLAGADFAKFKDTEYRAGVSLLF